MKIKICVVLMFKIFYVLGLCKWNYFRLGSVIEKGMVTEFDDNRSEIF